MLILGGVAALGVAERWVRVYDAKVTQILQCHQVLTLTLTVQPAAAECQGAKVLIDHIQQMFSPWKPAAQREKTEGKTSDLIYVTQNRKYTILTISNDTI